MACRQQSLTSAAGCGLRRIDTGSSASSARCSDGPSGFSRTCSTIHAPMALRNRVYGAGKVLILAAALGATYIVFAVASLQYALRSREVQVPDLTNRTTADASATISELGLTLKVDDVKRLDPRIPAGRVIAQEPAAGATSRQQRTI